LIWREVEVPTAITLNDVVQTAMGWYDGHLWQFTIGHETYGLPMGEDWGAVPRGAPLKARLRDVVKPHRTIINDLYHMGDSREHRLIVTKVRPGDRDKSSPLRRL
jgi:hypothetical protein